MPDFLRSRLQIKSKASQMGCPAFLTRIQPCWGSRYAAYPILLFVTRHPKSHISPFLNKGVKNTLLYYLERDFPKNTTWNRNSQEFYRRCKPPIVNPTWSPTIPLSVLWIVRAKARKNERPGEIALLKNRGLEDFWGSWNGSHFGRIKQNVKILGKFEGFPFPLNSD